jgi:hypothetical protein
MWIKQTVYYTGIDNDISKLRKSINLSGQESVVLIA